jgi:uncharacterized phage protein (TIGR01671 family)
MRDYLFRGKRIENGEWVYGFYAMQSFGNGYSPAIIQFCGYSTMPVKIIPETIGQWTGLVDKNGVKIFEGDILNTNDAITLVVWHITYFSGIQFVKGKYNQTQTEVIGNCIDNPEILEGACKN